MVINYFSSCFYQQLIQVIVNRINLLMSFMKFIEHHTKNLLMTFMKFIEHHTTDEALVLLQKITVRAELSLSIS